MKSFILYVATAIILIAIVYLYSDRPDPPAPMGRVTLEQILSVKELHLVRHEYNDLFFLHRNNDKSRPVRAIAQIPVTVTAYINLKELRFIRRGDSVEAIIIPHARLHRPEYHMDRMLLRETRSFHLHIGRDVYAQVATGLRSEITRRSDSLHSVAIRNHILTQTETEGKAWLEWFLMSVGRGDVLVKVE